MMRYRVGHRIDGDGDGDGPLRFVIATEGRKADGLDLQMDRLDLTRYESNPVIQPAHDWRAWPIGRGENLEVDGGKLLADAVFDLDDPVGAEVDRKYRQRFLNAVSVGFDIHGLDDETGVPERWDLLEFSAVTIPLDADAIVDSGRKRAAALAEALTGIREGDLDSERDRKLLETALGALTVLIEERGSEIPTGRSGDEPPADDDGEDGGDPEERGTPALDLRRRRMRLFDHQVAAAS